MKNFFKKFKYIRILKNIIFSFNPLREFSRFAFEYKKLQIRYSFQEEDKKKEISKERDIVIICGEYTIIYWIQMWLVFCIFFKAKRFKINVITSKKSFIQNLYFKLLDCNYIFLENLEKGKIDKNFLKIIKNLKTLEDFKRFSYENVPYGKMALSTYSRRHTTGTFNLDDNSQKEYLIYWLKYMFALKNSSDDIIKNLYEPIFFFSEVFMEEFGALYYSALELEKDIIQFFTSAREDCVVIKRRNKSNDREHISAVSSELLSFFNNKSTKNLSSLVDQNFEDRYSKKWNFSGRNLLNASNLNRIESRKYLKLKPNKKVAVLFNHIFYDTLFYNGEDIYESYSDWFIKTIKLACKNKAVRWFIKIHPANLWRGEFEDFNQLGYKFEEESLVRKHIGKLPNHISFIYPDTKLSPIAWMNLCDYGITVRGTVGIELAALGKTVITAGTGRYEKANISVNPKNIKEYENLILNLQNLKGKISKDLGIKLAYYTFIMKPYNFPLLKPITMKGFKKGNHVMNLGFKIVNKKDNILHCLEFINWCEEKRSLEFINKL